MDPAHVSFHRDGKALESNKQEKNREEAISRQCTRFQPYACSGSRPLAGSLSSQPEV